MISPSNSGWTFPDLASLPLGALRTAQRALNRTRVDSDSESESDPGSESDSGPEAEVKRAEKPEWSNKPRTDISKRKNKHA
jgi:ribosomal RNA-processing protein 36